MTDLYKNLMLLLSRAHQFYHLIGKEEHREYAKLFPQMMDEQVNQFLFHMAQAGKSNTQLSRTENVRMMYSASFMCGSREWARNQFPVFELTPDFFYSMALTNFGDALHEQFHPPFPALVLRFPENTVLGPIKGAFIYPLIGTGLTYLSASLGANRMTHVIWQNDGTPQDILDAAKEGGSAVQKLTAIYTRLTAEKEAAHGSGTVQDDIARWNKLLVRAYVNTVLYINASGGLPTERAKGGAAPAPIERVSKDKPLYRVGRVVKLGPHIRRALTEAKPGTSWALKTRHIVRGHWRNQAHGEKRALRRKQWIEPYWKGPKDLTEALERTYRVE